MTPVSNATDRAKAEAFFRDMFERDLTVSRQWIGANRARLIRQLAVAEMQKRQHLERKTPAIAAAGIQRKAAA